MATYQDAHLEQLLRDLVQRFDALQQEFNSLREQKQVLEDKLTFACGQFRVLEDKYAPENEGEFAAARAACRWNKQDSTLNGGSFDCILKGAEASDSIGNMMGLNLLTPKTSHPVKVGDTTSETVLDPQNIVPNEPNTAMEKDFTTTSGKPSQLQCPFAQAGNPKSNGDKSSHFDLPVSHRPPTPPDTKDSLHPQRTNASSRGAQPSNSSFSDVASCTSTNKCPIRFLGHQSPEDIAEYFEKHKHELPRSHAVCVKRFQSNTDSIRQLDAKYGNMVNMIQALGIKHKNYLPETPKPEDEVKQIAPPSNDRVENWARNVSSHGSGEGVVSAEAPEEEMKLNDEERECRFDRPLREVRVGESPSRPWGISVPIEYDEPPATPSIALDDKSVPHAIPTLASAKPMRPTGRCPFGHGAPDIPAVRVESRSVASGSVRPKHEGNDLRLPKASSQKDNAQTNVRPATPSVQPDTIPAANTAPNLITSAPQQPQMLFTGPVFIGYPIEQAIQLLQQTSSNMQGK